MCKILFCNIYKSRVTTYTPTRIRIIRTRGNCRVKIAKSPRESVQEHLKMDLYIPDQQDPGVTTTLIYPWMPTKY